jgi:hypothetical protein
MLESHPPDLMFSPMGLRAINLPQSGAAFYKDVLRFNQTDASPDPEGNRPELFLDMPWYCDQPLHEPIDCNDPDEALRRAKANAACLSRFQTRTTGQTEITPRMAGDQRG